MRQKWAFQPRGAIRLPPGSVVHRLGHLEKGELQVLGPQRDARTYHYEAATGALVPTAPSAYAEEEAISFYQTASWLYRHGSYREVTPEESARLMARQRPPHSAAPSSKALFR